MSDKKNNKISNSQPKEEDVQDQDIQFFSEIFGSDIKVEDVDTEEVGDAAEAYTEPQEVIVRREKTRGTLALVFVIGFFIIIVAGFLLVAFANSDLKDKAANLKDILLAISGILSGPLGFVVGYYFRKQDEENSQIDA